MPSSPPVIAWAGLLRTAIDWIFEKGCSTNAMAKLGKNEDVRVEVLVKICGVLNCSIDDILDIIPEQTA